MQELFEFYLWSSDLLTNLSWNILCSTRFLQAQLYSDQQKRNVSIEKNKTWTTFVWLWIWLLNVDCSKLKISTNLNIGCVLVSQISIYHLPPQNVYRNWIKKNQKDYEIFFRNFKKIIFASSAVAPKKLCEQHRTSLIYSNFFILEGVPKTWPKSYKLVILFIF